VEKLPSSTVLETREVIKDLTRSLVHRYYPVPFLWFKKEDFAPLVKGGEGLSNQLCGWKNLPLSGNVEGLSASPAL
jgi:hypothetical protein